MQKRYQKLLPKKSETQYLHPDNTVAGIACDMKPRARVHKRRVPALKDVAWISEGKSQIV